jgi:hypothetical protein
MCQKEKAIWNIIQMAINIRVMKIEILLPASESTEKIPI